MKLNKLFFLLCCPALFVSCFKDEPLNAECDIEEAFIHADNPEAIFANATDTLVKVLSTENKITFTVCRNTDISEMAPQFRLTEGAMVSPASGSVHDFSQGAVVYTVTSEDGEWSRQYEVSFAFPPPVYEELAYDFETYFLNENAPAKKYYVWSDTNEDGTLAYNWATGNAGYNMSNGSAKPDAYPTVPVSDGYDGACVKLTTCDTGAFGAMVHMPLAAGNLFLGKFDSTQALKNTMKATQFGLPVNFLPVSFSGYYKYQRGTKFINKSGQETDHEDYGTIYAVLYDNHDAEGNSIVLYGDNVQTSDQVVAIAKIDEIDNTAEWTRFDLDFTYKKAVDREKLANMGYSFAIVCSSSTDGGNFKGAIGSTLYVDKFRVKCEKED